MDGESKIMPSENMSSRGGGPLEIRTRVTCHRNLKYGQPITEKRKFVSAALYSSSSIEMKTMILCIINDATNHLNFLFEDNIKIIKFYGAVIGTSSNGATMDTSSNS